MTKTTAITMENAWKWYTTLNLKEVFPLEDKDAEKIRQDMYENIEYYGKDKMDDILYFVACDWTTTIIEIKRIMNR